MKPIKSITNTIKVSVIIFALLTVSCTSKLGDFTVISNQNVRGLEYGGKNRDEVQHVEAKSCTHRVYLTRTALGFVTLGIAWFMPPFDIVMGEKENDRMETAVDKAMKEGKKGVFDGDILSNAVIKETNVIVPLFYGYKCISAEGDVVSSITRTEGFLEKKKSD
jgi:hypothetical protein